MVELDGLSSMEPSVLTQQKAHYSPPWADVGIIGIAGASGSGKTSLAVEIIKSLNLPWVILLSIVGKQHSLGLVDANSMRGLIL